MSNTPATPLKKVIFYAPVGNLIKSHKSGGAEAGCRKTIAVLKKAGYDVTVVEKPAKKGDSVIASVILLIKLCFIWLKTIYIFITKKDIIFHVAGFYLKQVYFEKLLISTAHFFKVKSVYEIRNGGMIEAYNAGSEKYKKAMIGLLSQASLVLCQGYEYVEFLKSGYNIDSVYYPNYIMDDFLSDNNNGRENSEHINLIYFGRVVPDKNIDFIIDVCGEIENFNIPYRLDVIGGYEQSYHDQLSARIKSKNIDSSKITFKGHMKFDEIYLYLKKAHYFVFPSKEKREGHSNSLTEAMGCGVVPVVSTAGFNESIVGIKNLVIHEYNPKLYATIIADIWTNGLWKKYSDDVYNRISNNYTESIVKNSLLGGYSTLNS